jgi:hypothetical protein
MQFSTPSLLFPVSQIQIHLTAWLYHVNNIIQIFIHYSGSS